LRRFAKNVASKVIT